MDRVKTNEPKQKETEPPSRSAPPPAAPNGWKFSDWAAI